MISIHKKGAVLLSSQGTRERYTYQYRDSGNTSSVTDWLNNEGVIPTQKEQFVTGKQITVSESHPMNRYTGSYEEGGPFYTSRVTDLIQAGYVRNALLRSQQLMYTGPVSGVMPSLAEMKSIGYHNYEREFGDKNESQLLVDGTTAISACDPYNPASNLGSSLAEAFRDGLPSLPGIQSWEAKTNFLKGIGDEYLNYIFGWAPLKDEVSSVVEAARNQRNLLQQYSRGEGSDTHRRFDFPIEREESTLPVTHPEIWDGLPWQWSDPSAWRQVSLVRETKKWFEGSFTYALPSSSDNWRSALGFGSKADELYGISLNPEILWDLAPWSWALGWFTNSGAIINNITRFGLAGVVLRYGYIMEESIEKITAFGETPSVETYIYQDGGGVERGSSPRTNFSVGTECVTKRRYSASPFGFGISFDGLSPTQIAIIAALGLSKLL